MEKENRNKFWKGVLAGALVTALSGLVIVGIATGISLIGRTMIGDRLPAQGSGVPGIEAASDGLNMDRIEDKIGLLESIIDDRFLYEIDSETMESGIYRGLMAGIDDPYAVYYDAQEYQEMQESFAGTYCGIGVMVSQNINTRLTTVVRVFEGSPGEKAGMLPGDILYKVGDTDVTSMDINVIVNQHIKGMEGTVVRMTVLRDGQEVELKAVRAQVEVPTVEYKLLNDNTGYVLVTQFDLITASQFVEAVEAMEAEGMERLVIDLRGNPGGVLDSAVDMAAYLLPEDKFEGTLVYTEDKNGKGERYYCQDGQIRFEATSKNSNSNYPKEDGHQLDLPMAVLINGDSASAAELFAGCLQDYGWAKIVGTTSFGKGIVQNLIPLTDGSAIKLTTERYFTPSGFCLHEKGITPDVEEALNEELLQKVVVTPEEDNQLQKAIEVLKNPQQQGQEQQEQEQQGQAQQESEGQQEQEQQETASPQ